MARLADIQVDEVSLVDKAANKRKFLFVKREGGADLKLVKALMKNEKVIKALEAVEDGFQDLEKAIRGYFNELDKDADMAKVQMIEGKSNDIHDLHVEIVEKMEKIFDLEKSDTSPESEWDESDVKKPAVSHDNSSGVDSVEVVPEQKARMLANTAKDEKGNALKVDGQYIYGTINGLGGNLKKSDEEEVTEAEDDVDSTEDTEEEVNEENNEDQNEEENEDEFDEEEQKLMDEIHKETSELTKMLEPSKKEGQ